MDKNLRRLTLTVCPPSCRCFERSPGQRFRSPSRHAPSFGRACGRSSTVQLCGSFDWEAVADDNGSLELHHANGEVGDFSLEAGNISIAVNIK